MLQLGAINEVRKIMDKEKNSKNKNVLNTIGFNELKQYLEKSNIHINSTSDSVRIFSRLINDFSEFLKIDEQNHNH